MHAPMHLTDMWPPEATNKQTLFGMEMNLCRNYLCAYDSSITNGDVLLVTFLLVSCGVLRCGLFVRVMKLPCHVMCYIATICYSRFLYFVFHVHHSVLLIVV